MTPLLDTKQVATRLGVSERTVRNLVKFQGLPSHRIGARLVRFVPDEIDAWLDSTRPARDVDTPQQPRPARRAPVQLIA